MANETIILDSEEVYQDRGARHRSVAQFMDKKSLYIMVKQLKNQGKEVEEIAIELGLSNDEANRIYKEI